MQNLQITWSRGERKMLETKYERTMEHSYVLLSVKDYVKSFEEDMLKNDIPGVLPFHIEFEEQEVFYAYTITQKLSIQEYCGSGKLNAPLITNMLTQVIENIKGARSFLLEADNFVLDFPYIYVGNQGETFWLCYYIGYNKPIREQLIYLFEELMKQIDYSDEMTVKLVYELYQLAREKTCTYDQILEVLKSYQGEKEWKRETLYQPEYKLHEIMQEDIQNKKETNKRGVVALEEEITQEYESNVYPKSCYIKMGVAALAGGFLAYAFMKSNVFYNQFGELDYLKALCGLCVLGAVEIYLARKIFDSSKKETKIKRRTDLMPYTAIEEEPSKSASLGTEPNHAITSKMTDMIQAKDLSLSNPITREAYNTYETDKKDKNVLAEEFKTQVLFEERKTEVLGSKKKMILLPKDSSSMPIYLQQGKNVIGSVNQHANVLLPHSTISRGHAKIEYDVDHYCIEDLSSTNGTYLNGVRLKPNEIERLEVGDEIRFAELVYEVKFAE